MNLYQDLDPDKVKELNKIQLKLHSDIDDLSIQLTKETITPEQYLIFLNEKLLDAMKECRILLGEEDFYAFFGEAGNNPEGLIDRDIFLSQTSRVVAPYELVGYNLKTEWITEKHPINYEFVDEIREIIDITSTHCIVGDILLTSDQANKISDLIGVEIDLDKMCYFLEPYSV